MLYSIIPPILVVLSLAAIIVFLAKKAPQVARLRDEDEFEKEDVAKQGFWKRISGGMKGIAAAIGQMFLGIIARSTGGAKSAFMRLESKSKDLNESMKTRRLKKEKRSPEEIENNEDADIMNRLEEYQPEEKKKKKFSRRIFGKGEEAVKPIISAEISRPRARAEMKDRLEDLLIERIAANPKDSEAYERLGEYYMEIDSLVDAKECFKQVLKLDPKNADVKYRMRRLETMMHKK